MTHPEQTERHIQEQLFHLKRWKQNQNPLWRMLYPIPNGQYREGMRPEPGLEDGAGYPDVALDVARGGYHGLRIELKRPGEKPRANQIDWHERLREQGYMVVVAHSVEYAETVIDQYLDGWLMDEEAAE